MRSADDLWFLIPTVLLLFFLLWSILLRWPHYVPNLNNKAVLITGCDSGFGHELAHRLDKLGVTVFAGCLFPEGEGAHKLKSICSDKLHIIHLDVTEDDHVINAVKTVKRSLGDKILWGVVNNAGVGTIGDLEWMTVEAMQKMFDVNTLAPFRVTKAFLPLLRQSCGRVVFVASLAGMYPVQGVAAYSMSKNAVISLAHSLRRELEQFNISVHLINPSAYKTSIVIQGSNIPEVLRSYWKNLSEEVQSVYSEKYIDEYEDKVLNKWLPFASPESKIYEVVNDMETALLTRRPQTVYIPGMQAKIQFVVMCFMSTKVIDHLSNLRSRFHRWMRTFK